MLNKCKTKNARQTKQKKQENRYICKFLLTVGFVKIQLEEK